MAINPEMMGGNKKWEKIRSVWNEIAPMIEVATRRAFWEGFASGIVVVVIIRFIIGIIF